MMKIPLTQPVRGGQIGVKVSPDLGTQSLKALSQLAGTVGQVGQKIHDNNVKLARVENERLVNNYKAQIKRTTAEYNNELLTNNNPQEWRSGYNERIGSVIGGLDIQKLSPEAQQAFNAWSEDYRSSQELKIDRDSILQGVKNATLELDNNQREYEERGDFDSSRERIQTSSLLSDEEKRRSLLDIDGREEKFIKQQEVKQRRELNKAVDLDIKQDPFGAAERIEDPSIWTHLEPLEREEYKDKVKREVSSARVGIYDQVSNLITDNEVKSEKDIDDLSQRLTANQRQTLKDRLRKNKDVAYQKLIESPEEQSRITGEFSRLLDEVDANSDRLGDEVVKLKSLADDIKDKREKERALSLIDYKFKGIEAEIKTNEDWGYRQIKEHFKSDLIGALPEVKKVSVSYLTHITDGLFNAEETLKGVNFTEQEVAQIQKAKDKEGNVSPKAQVAVLRSIWNNRKRNPEGYPEAHRILEDLASGKSLSSESVGYDDPASLVEVAEAQAERDLLVGKAERQYSDWTKLNKDKPLEAHAEYINSLGVNIDAGETNADWLPPRKDESPKAVAPTYKTHKGNYKVSNKTRDQITGFSSKAGNRMISLDFNDASNKSARGIEIKVPDDATEEELEASRAWARETQAFFKKHGVDVPIRRGDGIKTGGSGKRGVFHTEPFFVANKAAMEAIKRDPEGYAAITGRTLGNIQGANFIPPHEQSGQGAEGHGYSETSFALKYIIPYL